MRPAWLAILWLLTIAPSAYLDHAGDPITYDFEVVSYDLTYEIDAARHIFTSTQNIKIVNAAGRKVDRIYFLLHPDLIINDLALRDEGGRSLPLTSWTVIGSHPVFPRPLQVIRVLTSRAIAPEETATLHLDSHLPPAAFKDTLASADHILDLTVNTGSSFAVSPTSGHYACFNRNLAAPFMVTVRYPKTYHCCVPGNLISSLANAGYVIDTYGSPIPRIPAFSCAPYQKIVRQAQNLTLEYYLYPGHLFVNEMAVVPARILQLYTAAFGDVGTHTYRFCTVGAWNSRIHGWENRGNAIYFTDLATRYFTVNEDAQGMFTGFIAHELFHNWNQFSVNWSGKLRNWFEEGGANFIGAWACEQLFSEQQGIAARSFFANGYDGSHGYNGYDARQTLESAYQNDLGNSEMVLIHYYGALVWEQLRQKVGDEVLFTALGDFFRTYTLQTVSYQDFLRCLQARTDVPVAEYLDQWFQHNALIDLSINQVNIRNAGERYRTEVDILVNADRDYDLFTSIGYTTTRQAELALMDLSLTRRGIHTVTFETTERPVSIQIDPACRVPQINLANNVWTP
ncbi:MAG: hypothetical protein JSU61_04615 [Fidelibacterota bacterium]|nr:MAG: hypothetical protein JSU61_04615 [Candidatus Neomarinimicrobiota bacterium]